LRRTSKGVRALFDVNVLIALLQPDHAHHRRAHAWWDHNGAAGWASCPLTQNGFVRIVSQPSYRRPVPISQALTLLAEQSEGTDHAFWPDDISLLDTARFDRGRILGPRQLTDIYLLGLAVKNGGRLATLDRTIPLAAVRGAGPRHVAAI
jgi:toxin-antitoxin system PIN domain toxin